jgi:hypothetical protein
MLDGGTNTRGQSHKYLAQNYCTAFLSQHAASPLTRLGLCVVRGGGVRGTVLRRDTWVYVPVPPAVGHEIVCSLWDKMPNRVKPYLHSAYL